MEFGIDPELFWSLSFQEVLDLIEAKEKQLINSQKLKARLVDGLATMIQERIGVMFADKTSNIKVRTVFEIFPELFKQEVKQLQKIQQERELEEYKLKFRMMAERFNAKKGALNE